MRRLLLGVVVLLLAGCASESGGSGGGSQPDGCVAIRHAIERDKVKVQDAQVSGDASGAAKARADVEADARAARSLSGCDISDLVGANVGQ